MGKIENLLINKGLYESVDITIEDFDEIEKCLSKSTYTENTVDCFCIYCKTNRVFEFVDSEVHEDTGFIRMAIDDANGTEAIALPHRYTMAIKRANVPSFLLFHSHAICKNPPACGARREGVFVELWFTV